MTKTKTLIAAARQAHAKGQPALAGKYLFGALPDLLDTIEVQEYRLNRLEHLAELFADKLSVGETHLPVTDQAPPPPAPSQPPQIPMP